MKLFVLILILSMLASWPARAMTVCYEAAEYAPWIYGTGTSPLFGRRGALVDFVQRAAEDINLPAVFVGLPWKRCLANLRENKMDGGLVSVYVPNRETFVRYPGKPGMPDAGLRLWQVEYSIFAHHDRDWGFNGQGFSRNTLIIGAPLGYAAHKHLESRNVHAVDDYDAHNGLKLVQNRRLDGYVVERELGNVIVRKMGLTDVVPLKVPLFRADWYLILSYGFHDRDPAQANLLWRAAAGVSKSQGLAILDEYRTRLPVSR